MGKEQESPELKACTSCKTIPKIHQHHGDGTVHYNLICNCKKTPLTRSSMGADTHEWNTKWFETDPQVVNDKAGYTSGGLFKKFHYYT